MKKLAILLLIILSINLVLATDVAYVLKNTGSPDSVLTAALSQINVSYSLVDDSLVASTNFSKYKMIIVQDEILNVPVDNFPSIVLSDYYYSNWSASVGSISSNQILRGENDLASPLNTGMPAIFDLYTSCCASGLSLQAYYLNGKKYGTSSTHQVGDIYDYIVAYKENPRRVFFGITKT
ncbi:MAG: hypothetical protein NT076_03540, partial [Candidatus Pacearchaeota archaeon]|nr:hypothetical protein [Candidatus Pacearchaeota archaeon]